MIVHMHYLLLCRIARGSILAKSRGCSSEFQLSLFMSFSTVLHLNMQELLLLHNLLKFLMTCLITTSCWWCT